MSYMCDERRIDWVENEIKGEREMKIWQTQFVGYTPTASEPMVIRPISNTSQMAKGTDADQRVGNKIKVHNIKLLVSGDLGPGEYTDFIVTSGDNSGNAFPVENYQQWRYQFCHTYGYKRDCGPDTNGGAGSPEVSDLFQNAAGDYYPSEPYRYNNIDWSNFNILESEKGVYCGWTSKGGGTWIWDKDFHFPHGLPVEFDDDDEVIKNMFFWFLRVDNGSNMSNWIVTAIVHYTDS